MISQYDNLTYAAYKPISMQEMWAPAAEMRQQHDKLQEDYAQQELLGGAASLGLQEKVDDKAIATNKAYMDATKAAADELATKGIIDSGRRRNLMNLKQQYAKEVLPIQNALKERDAAVKFDREMKAKDDSYESSFDPSKIAVTDYIGNTSAFTTKGASKSVVAQDVAQQMSQLKEQIQSDMPQVTGRILNDVLMRYNVGASPDQVNFIIQEAARANGQRLDASQSTKLGAMMKSIINGTLDKHGVFDKFKDPSQVQRFVNAAAQSSIYALNGPKLDKAHDNMADARDAAAQAPPPPGKSYVGYSSAFEPAEIAEGQRILDMSVVSGNSREAGRAMPGSPSTRNYKTSDDGSEYVRSVNLYAKKAGIEDRIPPGNHSKEDVQKRGEAIVRKAQESFKFANKSEFLPIDNKEFDTYLMNSLENKDGKIVDVNGKEHAPGSLFSEGRRELIFNKKGTVLSATTKDGSIVKIPVRDQSFGIASAQAPGQNPAFYENEHKSLGDDGFKSKYGYTLDQALGYIQSKTYNRATLQSKTRQKSEDVSPAYITPKL